MEQTLLNRFVDFAQNTPYGSLSFEAVHGAKRIVFDTLSVGLGGYQTKLGNKIVSFGSSFFSGNKASVIGSGKRSSLEGAAFCNAVLCKILGMDDSHRAAGHIAAQIVPAVMAIGESESISGKDLIRALVISYDLAIRFGMLIRLSSRERGVDIKGAVGPIAASMAAGLAMGLDSMELANAMALASNMGSGTEQYVYESGDCDTKDLISGFASRDAVFSVLLARDNFYGPTGAFDGEYGFFKVFGGFPDYKVFDDLGKNFKIMETAFKPHGGCRHTHQAVDAVQQILVRQKIETTAIKKIVVKSYMYAIEPDFRVLMDPDSEASAGLSIRAAVAVTLFCKSAWPHDYSCWDYPEVRRLRHIIDVEIDPELNESFPEKNGCRLELLMNNGEKIEGYVEYAKGEPESPMSDEEMKKKCIALNKNLLSVKIIDEFYQKCMELENQTELKEIIPLLKES